jgi:hypothetical protein
LKKLTDTDLLSVDTPARIAQRLERIANQPLVQMTIGEEQKVMDDRFKLLSHRMNFNDYIDFPKWAKKIDLSSGLG